MTSLIANARILHAIAKMALVIGLCEAAVAQDSGKTLKELKAGFKREAGLAAKPQLGRYIDKLKELEREAAQSRNYALATRIRDERMSATADWEQTSAQMRGSTFLKPTEALVSGGVHFEESTGKLKNWKDAAAKVSWRLPPALRTGAYSITIEYSNPDGEVTLDMKGDFQSISRTIPRTEGSTVASHTVSSLRLNESDASLSITVHGSGTDSFALESVTLVRLEASKANDGA